jgi:transcriptional regulator with XRE-family HTH domain
MTKRLFNKRDVVRLLRQEVGESRNQSAWARRTKVDRPALNRVLRGHRAPSPRILQVLRLNKIVVCSASNYDVRSLLHRAIKQAGSVSAWSRRTGIDRSLISRVLNGKRPPTPSFFRALKIKRKTLYVSIEASPDLDR